MDLSLDLQHALEGMTPESIAVDVSDTYPDITIEDAQRIKAGLTALWSSRTHAELDRLGKEYKALHRELRRRYRRSGEH